MGGRASILKSIAEIKAVEKKLYAQEKTHRWGEKSNKLLDREEKQREHYENIAEKLQDWEGDLAGKKKLAAREQIAETNLLRTMYQRKFTDADATAWEAKREAVERMRHVQEKLLKRRFPK